MTDYKFKVGYTKGGTVALPSDAPTINIMNVANGSLIVSAGTPTAGTGIPGAYSYTYSGSAGLDMIAVFKTADATVDQQDLHSYTPDILTTNIDTAISSRAGTVDLAAVQGTVNAIKIITDQFVFTIANQVDANALSGGGGSSITVADIWDALTSGLTTADSIGKLLVTDIDSKISLVGSALGAGAISTPITVDDGTNPIDGVDVWVTTDVGGSNVIARGYTNTSGVVTFMLDTGTVYIWKQLAGYSFSNPDTLVVT